MELGQVDSDYSRTPLPEAPDGPTDGQRKPTRTSHITYKMDVSLVGPGGKILSKEESATSESSSSVMEKDVGNKHILAKESSFSAEQKSKVVAESVDTTATSVVSRKVSSTSVVSQSRSVTSSSETSVSQVKSITQG